MLEVILLFQAMFFLYNHYVDPALPLSKYAILGYVTFLFQFIKVLVNIDMELPYTRNCATSYKSDTL